MTPVKLLTAKVFFAHLRQGLPDRSRLRKLLFIAPVFALGPSLWFAPVGAGLAGLLLLWSMVPSSLFIVSGTLNWLWMPITYNLGFFFGPGFPRGLGVPFVSLICPGPRFIPASALPLGLIVPLPLVASVGSIAPGAGVDADSDTASLTSGTLSVDGSSMVGLGDDVCDAEDCSSDFIEAFGDVSRRSSFGDNLRMMSFVCFLLLSVRVPAEGDLLGVAGEAIPLVF
jgi:hypothetical protein